jgi:hypothetical protein
MIAHYIKAANEANLWDSLEAAGLATKQYDPEDPANIAPEGAEDFVPTGKFDWVKADGFDLDIIGVIYKPTGEVDDEGSPEMGPIEGYHANIRKWDGELSEEQLEALPLIEAPSTPARVWA